MVKLISRSEYSKFATLILFLLCTSSLANSQETRTLELNMKQTTVVESIPQSWSINLAPDNKVYVTHRAGGFSVYDEQWQGVRYKFSPTDLYYKGQGGLLDLEFHPEYAVNGWIYLSYSAGTDNENALKVVRFKLHRQTNTVVEVQTVLVLNEPRDTPVHYGGRLAFIDDGSLLISSGDGFDYRERAQILNSQQGKVLRVSDTGMALPDNPFFTTIDAPESKVYTLGHRNPQALIVLENGTVIAHEHGPAGGDEVNILQAGVNFGWPVVTNGMDYIGSTISPFRDYPNMRLPDHDWTPSIAPSGMTFFDSSISQKVNNKMAEKLNSRLLITSLKLKQVHSLMFKDGKISDEALVYKGNQRLRDISLDSLGNILLLTDGENSSVIKLAL